MAQADYLSNAVRALVTGAAGTKHPPTQSGRHTSSLSPPSRGVRRGQSRCTPTLATSRTAPIT